jgi:hypothetical protein
MAEENVSVDERAGVSSKNHADNALVFGVLVLLIVCSGQCLGRWAGNRLDMPGAVAFFGG